MILVAYRHGFRAAEVCDLVWSAIDFARAEMHVNRKKSGKPSIHPIRGDELRELRKVRKRGTGSFVFMSERGGRVTATTPARSRTISVTAIFGTPFATQNSVRRASAISGGEEPRGDACMLLPLWHLVHSRPCQPWQTRWFVQKPPSRGTGSWAAR
jgi:hypothetical protein